MRCLSALQPTGLQPPEWPAAAAAAARSLRHRRLVLPCMLVTFCNADMFFVMVFSLDLPAWRALERTADACSSSKRRMYVQSVVHSLQFEQRIAGHSLLVRI